MDQHPDPLDTATELAQQETEARIQAHRARLEAQRRLPSAVECEHCDAPIPEARRALGGVRLCVDCAEEAEHLARLGPR
jgi:phage/conjugal plasmid C-4 type zinc finger TraR family protein